MNTKKENVCVSILCWTYNHEKFIRDCLEGILKQNTDFEFEIIVHDDASNDATVNIIKDYEKRYPELIWGIYESENQYSKNGFLFIDEMLKKANGKFIAFCEGDDYWTDPAKLQEQVNLLIKEPTASACFHLMEMKYEDGRPSEVYPPAHLHRDRFFEDIAFSYWLSTGSIVCRKEAIPVPIRWAKKLYMADVPLIAELCLRGNFRFINKVMGVYRQHLNGIWVGIDFEKKCKVNFELYNTVLNEFSYKKLPLVEKEKKESARRLFMILSEKHKWKEARWYLWQYFISSPARFSLPPKQKKSILKALINW